MRFINSLQMTQAFPPKHTCQTPSDPRIMGMLILQRLQH